MTRFLPGRMIRSKDPLKYGPYHGALILGVIKQYEVKSSLTSILILTRMGVVREAAVCEDDSDSHFEVYEL